jgi:hypothetical protein
MNAVSQVIRGAQEHPWRTLLSIGVAFSVLWTAVESLTNFFPALGGTGAPGYAVLVGGSIFLGLIHNRKRSEVRFRIPATNTTVHVKFGDLFSEQGVKVIPVNEYFDSHLGDHVAERSVHGQFIRRFMGGFADQFDRLVQSALTNSKSEEVTRHSGKPRKFELGTTAVIPVNHERFLLTATACTNVETLKASCSVPDLWRSLEGIWDKARVAANGEPVVLPLIGSGQGGVPLAPQELLRFIVLSAVSASRKERITGEIRIVLMPALFNEISLAGLDEGWT